MLSDLFVWRMRVSPVRITDTECELEPELKGMNFD